MARIKNKILEQLFMELRFAPKIQRESQLSSAEKLLGIIENDREYPFEFVCYRITGYRPKTSLAEDPLKGEALAADLRVFIRKLSGQLELAASEQSEKVYTLAEMTERFSVSSKTISRWRKRDLRARIFLFDDGKKRLGFLESEVDNFLQDNPGIVSKAETFRRLSWAEKDQIIATASKLSGSGDMSRNQIIKQISAATSRARETIRYILADYEKTTAESGIKSSSGVISQKDTMLIYKLHKQGESVPALMKKFDRSRSSIYRIINKRKIKALLARGIRFVESAEFLEEGAEEKILLQDEGEFSEKTARETAPLLLNREQEIYLFRKYNYLKYLACLGLEKIKHANYHGGSLKKIEDHLGLSETIKKAIIEANLRLVVSIANKHFSGGTNIQDLVSEGNFSLMRAVEKFDYTKGYRFSTYATWAIAKDFARKIPAETSRPDRPGTADMTKIQQDMRIETGADISAIEHAQRSLDHIIRNNLTEREQYIIRNHFGLDGNKITKKGKSMKQIGDKLNISKERVRQIELVALQKLRHSLSDEEFDLLTG